ncbi:hypothetical protein [Pontibacter liquoris]|uniref:hypothetical protein n=1 Tax=Pontibacter liquoris TaxID=2905677 RepID=UPI001FA75782|nr:hypothetical protein [Pontibacter liquoris]
MILFENSIIKLDYTPATDILAVGYPDLHGFLLPEIKHNIDILIDTVKNYDVKKVLLDASHTVMSVGMEESREVTIYLAQGFSRTRVEKIARLQSLNETIEMRAKATMQHLAEIQLLPFQLQNFSVKADALAWLQH